MLKAIPNAHAVYFENGFIKIGQDGLLCLGVQDVQMEIETFMYDADMGRTYHKTAGASASRAWIIDKKGNIIGGQSFSVGWQEIDGRETDDFEPNQHGRVSPPSAAFIADVLAQLESRMPAPPQPKKISEVIADMMAAARNLLKKYF